MYQLPDQSLQWVCLNPEVWHSSLHNSWPLLELSTISSPWQSWCNNHLLLILYFLPLFLWSFAWQPDMAIYSLLIDPYSSLSSRFMTMTSSVKIASLILSKCSIYLLKNILSYLQAFSRLAFLFPFFIFNHHLPMGDNLHQIQHGC